MNRFQDPVQSIDVTLTPLHPDHTYFPLGQAGPLFFWYKRGKNPIKGFKISSEAEGAPGGGYERVRVNLHQPEELASILWCKRGGNESPIVDARIGPGEQAPGEGFERSEAPLLEDSYLWFKTQESSRKLNEEDQIFYVGARFDVRDGRSWRAATVVAVKPEFVHFNYEGWTSKWDENLFKTDGRIQPLWSMSKGEWTGAGKTGRLAFLLSDRMGEFEEHLQTVEALQTKFAAKTALAESEVDFLLRREGQWFLRWALHSTLDKQLAHEQAALIQRYIQAYLGLVLTVLQTYERQVDPNWLNVLLLALGGDRRNCGYFYENYGFGAPLAIEGRWAEISEEVTTYLVENVNFFGSKGGFERLKRLLDPDTKASFTATVCVLQCLQYLLPSLSKGFVFRYFQELDVPRVLRGIIANLTEEELRNYEHQVILRKVRSLAVALLPNRNDPQQVDLFLEQCDLELLDVVIALGVFKQKMQAMTHLGRIIEAVIPPQAKRYLTGENPADAPDYRGPGQMQWVRDAYGRVRQQWVPEPPPPPPVKYLTAEYVVDWILRHDVVHRMLGKDSHEQLVRKTAQVLKFLAQQKKIDTAHLELLWNAHAGAPEATVRVLQDTVTDLAQELSREHLDFLFERIKQKPLNRYKDYDLSFVKQFTVAALRAIARRPTAAAASAAGEEDHDVDVDVALVPALQELRMSSKNFYGLDIFWQAVLDETISAELRSQAFDILRELLRKPSLADQREVYAERCIQMLQSNLEAERPASTSYVLRLIRDIVAAVEEPRAVAEAIEALENNFGLLELILKNAVRYSGHAQASVLVAAAAAAAVAPGAHHEEMQTSLNLVESCVTYSRLTLSQVHAELLWQAFVEQAAAPSDATLLLEYLSASVPRSASVFCPEAVELLFEKLCSGDVTAFAKGSPEPVPVPLVSETWYVCFERFFLFMNTSAGAISSTQLVALYTLDHARLRGEDSLWKLACEALDPVVSERARLLLTLLYSRLDLGQTPEAQKAILGGFIAHGMRLLAEVANDLDVQKQLPEARSVLVGQVVLLLEGFLNRITSEDSHCRPLFVAGEPALAYWLSNKKNIKYEAKVIGVNEDGTYVVKYKDGDTDSKCPERNLFNVDGSPRPVPAVDPEVLRHPEQLLASNNEFFGLFFKLLGLGGATAQLVWSLLSTLPTNADLLQRMGSLVAVPEDQAIDWGQLLPSDSFIKLLYTLRIVRSLIHLPEASEADLEDSEEDEDGSPAAELTEDHKAWRRMFLARGGLAHLYQAFIQMPDESVLSGELPKQSVVCILQILKHFLLGPEETTQIPPAQAQQVVDLRQLVHRVLACLHATVLGQIADDCPEQETLAHAVLLRQLGVTVTSLLRAQPDPEQRAALVAHVYQFPHWREILYHGLLKRQHDGIMQELRTQITTGIWETLSDLEDRDRDNHHMEVDEEDGAAAGESPHQPELAGQQSKLRCFFLPLLLQMLLEIDPNSKDLDIVSYFGCVRQLLRQYRLTAEVMEVWPVAQRLTELIQKQPFEEDSNVTDHVMVGLLNLASQLVGSLDEPLRHVFGVGGGTEGGGALQDDPALCNAIDAVCGIVELDPCNTGRGGGTGLVVRLLNYLFDIPRNSSSSAQQDLPPKFKSKTTRSAAFGLLRCIAQRSPRDSMVICRGLMPNHVVTAENDTFNGNTSWNYEFREYEVKRRGAYVGLRNLGCICYMNSSLQQLFMVPKLRQDVLAIDDCKSNEDERGNLVFQLQHLFANLQESTESCVSPQNLTDIWIGEDGRPINVGKQEDSADFVNTLIDRISDRLKGTRFENTFNSVIKGQIADQIIGRGGCPHYREQAQPFHVLPVEIKGKKTLQEALDGFVQGEMMAGDNKVNCEQCGSKQAVFKRQTLKQLPPVLCVNLKRFALDYETFETVKINARLEFPMELDMRPYTIENMPIPEDSLADEAVAAAAAGGGGDDAKVGEDPEPEAEVSPKEQQQQQQQTFPDEYYQYVLRGVVVHTGDVNRGHYYSYIQERSADPNKPGRWYCFNDHSVKPFDPKNLEAAAFGGDNTIRGQANAYLLFYDRKCSSEDLLADDKGPQEVQPAPPAQPEEEEDGDYALVDKEGREEKQQEVCQIAGGAKVPGDIFQRIWQQNITSARDKLVYDPDYFDFLASLLRQISVDFPPVAEVHPRQLDLQATDLSKPVDLRDAASRLAARFMLKSLARCTHKAQLNPLGATMAKLYERNVSAAAWLLWYMTTEPRCAEHFMIQVGWDDVRKHVGFTLASAVRQVAPAERELLATLLRNEVPAWAGVPPLELQPGDLAIDLPASEKPAGWKENHGSWDLELTPDAKVNRRDGPVLPAPKGYTASFMDTLVRVLPVMAETPHWIVDFCRVWDALTTVEPLAAEYGARRGYMGHLLDVWLCNESPHRLVAIPMAPGMGRQRRVELTDTCHINLSGMMVSLWNMAQTNLRNFGTPWGESEVVRDMLLSPAFLEWLPLETSTYERGLALSQLMVALATENAEVTEEFIRVMAHWLHQADFDVCRPIFRWLPAFLAIEDSLSEARRLRTIESLIQTIMQLRVFWKDFDFYLAHLIRLAKVSPVFRDWLKENPDYVQQFIGWLEQLPEPPQRNQDRLRRFRKRDEGLRRKYRTTREVNTLTSLYSGPQDMPADQKVLAFQALLADEPLPGLDAGYDSDSENHAVDWDFEQLVDVRDSALQWHRGKVVNKLGNSIRISWPHPQLTEWIKLRQFRIAPDGSFSHLTPQQQVQQQPMGGYYY